MGYVLVIITVPNPKEKKSLIEVHLCRADDVIGATKELSKAFSPLEREFTIKYLLPLQLESSDEATKLLHELMKLERGVKDSMSSRMAYLLSVAFIFGWNVGKNEVSETESAVRETDQKDSSECTPVPKKDKLN